MSNIEIIGISGDGCEMKIKNQISNEDMALLNEYKYVYQKAQLEEWAVKNNKELLIQNKKELDVIRSVRLFEKQDKIRKAIDEKKRRQKEAKGTLKKYFKNGF